MESKSIDKQLSIQLYPDYNVDSENYSKNLKAEPQQPNHKGLDLPAAVKNIKNNE